MTTLSDFTQDSSELSEIILCLILWMGGDVAIFNKEELIYYLPHNKDDIKICLEELENAKILNKQGDNYTLTKKGSFLVSCQLCSVAKYKTYVCHNVVWWIGDEEICCDTFEGGAKVP